MARSKKPRKKKVTWKEKIDRNHRAVVETHIDTLVLTHWESAKTDDGENTYTSNKPWEVVDVASMTKREWKFTARVKSMDIHGKEFYDEAYLTTPPILINDLSDFYPTLLKEALVGVNTNLVIDKGWQARPLTKALRKWIKIEEALAS